MKVKISIRIFLVIFILSNTLLAINTSYALEEKPKSILVLNSYHKGFPWTDNLVKGIESFVKPGSNNVKLIVEYMDTKAMGFDEEYKLKIFDFLSYKYQQKHFDIIISTDDNAFNFLKEFHEILFPGVPIVVCGVNNRNAPKLVDPSKFTGILESTSHEETIELILKLHPETKKIYLVIDTTPSGEYRWVVTEPSFQRFNEIEFIRLSDEYTITEIEDIVGGLKSDSVVIFFTLYRDQSGEYFTMKESVTRLAKSSARPIYTTHLLELPYGVVGGKVLGGFHHGETIAKIAMRILNGEDVRNVPFLLKSPTQYIFDYSQLNKWGIKYADLPEKSIILNEPFSIYDAYKFYIWSASAIIIILLFIIFFLQANILKRKNAERAQLESERKYKALFENERNAIFIYDPVTMAIIDSNPSMTALYGYTQEELIGMNCLNLSTEVDKSIAASSKAVKEGNINVKTRWHKKKDGTVFPLEIDVYRIEIMGKTQGYAVIRDITKQKELESNLIQSQKMEAIGTLAGGIAHDFNNILSSIIGFTELALDASPKGSLQRDDLEEVYIAGNRAKELVQQILAFARQSEQKRKPVRLSDIVTEALKLLRPSTPTTINIKSTINSAVKVIGNTSQLHQIVMNLCTNSIHSLQKKGGILEISLGEIIVEKGSNLKASELPAGKYLEFTVADNGPGIEPAIIEKIFEPYFTTKGVGEGTGMGLAMVKGIVESYGGDIQVKSEPGKSTSFVIRLPVATGKSFEGEDQVDLVDLGKERILFVDDEPPIARMGSRMLESIGYSVTIRTSSFEALELFKEKPDDFDLVITDMTMPSMTGDVLSMEIRKIRHDIPIILCTGYSNKIDDEGAKQIGIDAFAYKPFTKPDLARIIREVLDKNQTT